MTRPDRRLGIDLGGTKIEAAILDGDGTVVWRERVPTPAEHRYDATLAALQGLVQRADAALGGDPADAVMPVGIGMPGSLTHSGLVKNANSTYLNGRPFAADLTALLQRPVRVANDANCMALSEASDGAAQGAEVVFGVILGTGVGGGIVVRSQLLTGPNGLCGEWGHNPLPWLDDEERSANLTCYCGRSHCIESWLSGPGLLADHRRRARASAAGQPNRVEPNRVEAIVQAAALGDADCEATLARYTERLARALAAVINLLDPDVIVLAGGLSRLDRLYADVPRQWSGYVFSAGSGDPVRTRLVPARHGDASGVRGAAWLWPRTT
jgi:fructokinase